MDKQFRYRHKNVFDIPVEGSVVRLWSTEGTAGSKEIEKAFRPLMRTSYIYPYIALMPDFHPGEGSMIGSVIPSVDVLFPTVIGGDLGCGMTAVRLPVLAETLFDKLRDIYKEFKKNIPTGTSHNPTVSERVKTNPIWKHSLHATVLTNKIMGKISRQFASLGGGNHFLEVQEDNEGMTWIMLHTGSRYLGVLVRDYYIEAGKRQDGLDHRLYRKVPYLKAGTDISRNYLDDLTFVLDFARESRREIMLRAVEVVSQFSPDVEKAGGPYLIDGSIDTTHNYIAEEEHFETRLFIHRKGAIKVTKGEPGLIPGSMGTNSYVVEGKGNQYSFCSCSHGAGRAMSRSDAFRRISDKDFADTMQDIMFDYDQRLKDEAPPAYKNIRQVMRGQKDLIAIRYTLNPLLSMKGM